MKTFNLKYFTCITLTLIKRCYIVFTENTDRKDIVVVT